MSNILSRRRFVSLLGPACVTATLPVACGRSPEIKTYAGAEQAVPTEAQSKAPAPSRPLKGTHAQNLEQSDAVFSLSIASGDPSERGVILWTRIDPAYYRREQVLRVELARDMMFGELVYEAEIPGAQIDSAQDYCVKLDTHPYLEPFQTYYYRFIYGRYVSRIGRCRTLPESRQEVERLVLAQISCQDFGNGYYGTYQALSKRDDVDFVLHLGDFIYETSGDPRFQKNAIVERQYQLPSGQAVAMDRNDYNTIYRTYRSDSYLRRCLEAHTFIMIPDDHELANDYYWDYEKGAPGIPDHPYQTEAGYTLDDRRRLRKDAIEAWHWYTPTRLSPVSNSQDGQEQYRIYRDFRFGTLAHLSMLDERSFRTGSACGSGDLFGRYFSSCKGVFSEKNTLLGRSQLDWLLSNLQREKTRWHLLGNQVPMAPLRLAGSHQKPILADIDGWDGFAAERSFLLEAVRYLKLDNFVVLSGDLHTGLCGHLKRDFTKAQNFDLDNTVGVEFMTPSISSAHLEELVGQNIKKSGWSEKLIDFLSEKIIKRNNPHLAYFDSKSHGFAIIEIQKSYSDWSSWAVDPLNPEAPAWVQKRYRKWNLNPLLEDRT